MKINITYKDSVRNAPAGYKTAVEAAVKFVEHAFTDPITINILVGFGEIHGDPIVEHAAAQSSRSGDVVTYEQIRAAIGKKVASVDDVVAYLSLPQSDPTNGGVWSITTAQARALGIPVRDVAFDGEFALRSDINFAYDPDNRLLANGHDAIGLILHEITEIMGRWQYSGTEYSANGTTFRAYASMDLYRYAAVGVRALTPGDGYFSFDGKQLLTRFNNSRDKDDAVDWHSESVVGDAFGANYEGVVSAVTALDMRVMDIVGFRRAPAPHSDLNGDAVGDVLWRNPFTGDTGYWAMNGGVATWQGFGLVSPEWKIVGKGDFNGDYTQDLVWYNTATADVGFWDLRPEGGAPFWTYLGNGQFEWDPLGAGDINGDGRTDIIWRHVVTGEVGYWAMGPNAPSWNFIHESALSYVVKGIGDFDANGRADILWQDPNTGDTGVFLLDTKGEVSWAGYGQILFSYQIQGVGDCDGNGTSDILWRAADGTTGYWAMDKSANPTWHDLGVTPLDFKVLAMADYNGDGSSDILWRSSGGMTGYWAMHNGQPTWHSMGDTSTQYAVVA